MQRTCPAAPALRPACSASPSNRDVIAHDLKAGKGSVPRELGPIGKTPATWSRATSKPPPVAARSPPYSCSAAALLFVRVRAVPCRARHRVPHADGRRAPHLAGREVAVSPVDRIVQCRQPTRTVNVSRAERRGALTPAASAARKASAGAAGRRRSSGASNAASGGAMARRRRTVVLT